MDSAKGNPPCKMQRLTCSGSHCRVVRKMGIDPRCPGCLSSGLCPWDDADTVGMLLYRGGVKKSTSLGKPTDKWKRGASAVLKEVSKG